MWQVPARRSKRRVGALTKLRLAGIHVKGSASIMNTTAALIGSFGIMIAMLCAVGAAYYSERKPQISNDNLEYLEDVAREHAHGIADNRKRLQRLIHMVESNYALSVAQTARMERVRSMLRKTSLAE